MFWLHSLRTCMVGFQDCFCGDVCVHSTTMPPFLFRHRHKRWQVLFAFCFFLSVEKPITWRLCASNVSLIINVSTFSDYYYYRCIFCLVDEHSCRTTGIHKHLLFIYKRHVHAHLLCFCYKERALLSEFCLGTVAWSFTHNWFGLYFSKWFYLRVKCTFSIVDPISIFPPKESFH